MDLWSVRVEADNSPGQLAEIARVLAEAGANIVSLDVHATGATRVADDLVVSVSTPVDASALAALLDPLDARLVDLQVADAHELVDRVTRALEMAGHVVRDGGSRDVLATAITRLVASEVTYVRPVVDGLPLTGIAARAVAQQRPVAGRELVKSLPGTADGAWVLAVPAALAGRAHVAVAARRSPRFSFTETARIGALLGISEAVSQRVSQPGDPDGSVVVLRDGGQVVVRPLSSSDEGALGRLHLRCSATTVRRRYFSSMRTLPPSVLRLLLDVDGSRRLAVAAALGSELIGVAHLDVGEDGTAEVAVLVEDSHHRRGIGSALLAACDRAAARRGIHVLTALCLADNDAFPRLVRRCGYDADGAVVDGVRELSFRIGRGTAPAGPRASGPDGTASPMAGTG